MTNNSNKILVIGLVGKSDFMRVDSFPQNGETILVKEMHIEYGGKGINQAIAAKRFGSNVQFITKMGNDDIYQKTKELLEKEQIEYQIFTSENGISAEACIITNQNGDNEVICYPGKDVEITKEEILSIKDDIISANYLLLQFELSLESLYQAIDIAWENHVKVILNPAPYQNIDKSYLDKCYLLTPNENEAMKLFNIQDITCESIKNLPYHKVIITLGGDGCLIKDEESCYKIPSIKVNPIDTTGAGDTFNGILVSALNNNYSLLDASNLSVIGSGLSVTKKYVYDSIPNYQDVLNYKQKFKL